MRNPFGILSFKFASCPISVTCKGILVPIIQSSKIDSFVKSPKNVMPDPVSGTGQARSGIQNILKLLDSGFRRNDRKWCFLTFYDFARFRAMTNRCISDVPSTICRILLDR